MPLRRLGYGHVRPRAHHRGRRHCRRHPRQPAHQRHGFRACSRSSPTCSKGLAADRAVRAAVIAADGPAFLPASTSRRRPGLDRAGPAAAGRCAERRLRHARRLAEAAGSGGQWPRHRRRPDPGVVRRLADRGRRAPADQPRGSARRRRGSCGVAFDRACRALAVAARRLVLLGEDARPPRSPRRCDRRRARAGRGPAGARHRPGRAPTPRCRRKPSPPPSANCAPPSSSASTRRAGHGEPRLAAWLGEEMRRASAAVLRASSAVLRGAACSGFAGRFHRAIVRPGRRPDDDNRAHAGRDGADADGLAGAGAEQGAFGARARSAGQDDAAHLQRRQRHRQLRGLPRQALQAVPRAVFGRAAGAAVPGVQQEARRLRHHRRPEARLRSGAQGRRRRQAAGERLLPYGAVAGSISISSSSLPTANGS